MTPDNKWTYASNQPDLSKVTYMCQQYHLTDHTGVVHVFISRQAVRQWLHKAFLRCVTDCVPQELSSYQGMANGIIDPEFSLRDAMGIYSDFWGDDCPVKVEVVFVPNPARN
jgi:hypothetical protein